VDIKSSSMTPSTIYLKDYQPPAFLIDAVRLRFELHETETLVTSVLTVRANPDAKKTTD
jgi:aminopeptidase N